MRGFAASDLEFEVLLHFLFVVDVLVICFFVYFGHPSDLFVVVLSFAKSGFSFFLDLDILSP